MPPALRRGLWRRAGRHVGGALRHTRRHISPVPSGLPDPRQRLAHLRSHLRRRRHRDHRVAGGRRPPDRGGRGEARRRPHHRRVPAAHRPRAARAPAHHDADRHLDGHGLRAADHQGGHAGLPRVPRRGHHGGAQPPVRPALPRPRLRGGRPAAHPERGAGHAPPRAAPVLGAPLEGPLAPDRALRHRGPRPPPRPRRRRRDGRVAPDHARPDARRVRRRDRGRPARLPAAALQGDAARARAPQADPRGATPRPPRPPRRLLHARHARARDLRRQGEEPQEPRPQLLHRRREPPAEDEEARPRRARGDVERDRHRALRPARREPQDQEPAPRLQPRAAPLPRLPLPPAGRDLGVPHHLVGAAHRARRRRVLRASGAPRPGRRTRRAHRPPVPAPRVRRERLRPRPPVPLPRDGPVRRALHRRRRRGLRRGGRARPRLPHRPRHRRPGRPRKRHARGRRHPRVRGRRVVPRPARAAPAHARPPEADRRARPRPQRRARGASGARLRHLRGRRRPALPHPPRPPRRALQPPVHADGRGRGRPPRAPRHALRPSGVAARGAPPRRRRRDADPRLVDAPLPRRRAAGPVGPAPHVRGCS